MRDIYPYEDVTKEVEERITDLMGRLSLEEKVSLFHQYQYPIENEAGAKTGLFRTGTEALHGVAWLGRATVFPEAVGLGMTWNPSLLEKIGAAVGDEVRGKYNCEDNHMQMGLNVWTPVVDLQRNPLAGRNEEAYSEDPVLTGALSTAFASGLLGEDEYYVKTIPTVKHFFGYNNEENRMNSNSSMDPRSMHEYHLLAYKLAIESGKALAAMTSYNRINGIPAILHPFINEKARAWAPGDFLVVSDAFDPKAISGLKKYTQTREEGAALAIRSGLNSFTDEDSNAQGTIDAVLKALEQGYLTEEDIDLCTRQILRIRFRTGEWDGDRANPYDAITSDAVASREHEKLAAQAALEQAVLLKNEGGIFPIKDWKDKKIAIIGPSHDQCLADFYSGEFPYRTTLSQSLREQMDGAVIKTSSGMDTVVWRSERTGKLVEVPECEEGGVMHADGELSPVQEDGLVWVDALNGYVSERNMFEVYDYGWDEYCFRSVYNSKFVDIKAERVLLTPTDDDPSLMDGAMPQMQLNYKPPVNCGELPNGFNWVTGSNYHYLKNEDGTYSIKKSALFGKEVFIGVDQNGALCAVEEPVDEAEVRFRAVIVKSHKEVVKELAQEADYVIAAVGDAPQLHARETLDRKELILAPAQEILIHEAAAANPNTAVVLVTGNPYAIPAVDGNPNVKAILLSSHAGQEQGHALASIITGSDAPSGRLAQTWYRSQEALPDSLREYNIIEAGLTYQYTQKDQVLYPFGYGLTYTEFSYKNIYSKYSTAGPGDQLTVYADVKNEGSTDAYEVIQLYSKISGSGIQIAKKVLRAFEKIMIRAGETRTVALSFPVQELQIYDPSAESYYVERGIYELQVGRSSQDIRGSVKTEIQGEQLPVRDFTRMQKAWNYDRSCRMENVEVSRENTSRRQGGYFAVRAAQKNAWVKYFRVNMDGVSKIEVHVAGAAAEEEYQIEIRIDKSTGPLIGAAVFGGTGHAQQWRKEEIRIKKQSGVHDFYLVFPKKDICVDKFRFYKE